MRVSLSRLASSLLAAVALLTTPHAAAAQTGTASLSGTVTDDQKSAVPGATVTITSATTGLSRDAVTGDNGGYQFIALPPGVYTVKAELAGFKTSSHRQGAAEHRLVASRGRLARGRRSRGERAGARGSAGHQHHRCQSRQRDQGIADHGPAARGAQSRSACSRCRPASSTSRATTPRRPSTRATAR